MAITPSSSRDSQRLDGPVRGTGADGRWAGHAADYVAVAATRSGPAATHDSLANAIGQVAVDGVDPLVPDRAVGRIVAISPPPTTPLRVAAPTFPSTPTGVADGR